VVIIRSELHMHLKSRRCKKLLKVITHRLTQTQDELQCWYSQYYSNMHNTIMSFKHSCFLIKFINNFNYRAMETTVQLTWKKDLHRECRTQIFLGIRQLSSVMDYQTKQGKVLHFHTRVSLPLRK
jgi:hypothetical protein